MNLEEPTEQQANENAEQERLLEQLSLWQQEEELKTKNKMIKYIAKVSMKDAKNEWEEDLEVGSRETAQADIQRVVDRFNANLRSWETEREVVSINSIIEQVVQDNNMDDLDDMNWEEDEPEDEEFMW